MDSITEKRIGYVNIRNASMSSINSFPRLPEIDLNHMHVLLKDLEKIMTLIAKIPTLRLASLHQ